MTDAKEEETEAANISQRQGDDDGDGSKEQQSSQATFAATLFLLCLVLLLLFFLCKCKETLANCKNTEDHLCDLYQKQEAGEEILDDYVVIMIRDREAMIAANVGGGKHQAGMLNVSGVSGEIDRPVSSTDPFNRAKVNWKRATAKILTNKLRPPTKHTTNHNGLIVDVPQNNNNKDPTTTRSLKGLIEKSSRIRPLSTPSQNEAVYNECGSSSSSSWVQNDDDAVTPSTEYERNKKRDDVIIEDVRSPALYKRLSEMGIVVAKDNNMELPENNS